MHFAKFTILSLVALATALPNAVPEPEPEPAVLDARTSNWYWRNNKCDCDCRENHYRRDVDDLESRGWSDGIRKQLECKKHCKKKCDDWFEGM